MVDWLLRFIGALILLVFVTVAGGRIEGYIAPVVSGFEIKRTEAAENGQTRVWGVFTINRPGCDFYGLDWFQKGATREALVAVVFEEGTRVRDGGLNEFGPWRVQIEQERIFTQSHVVAYHSCAFRPYKTETDLLK